MDVPVGVPNLAGFEPRRFGPEGASEGAARLSAEADELDRARACSSACAARSTRTALPETSTFLARRTGGHGPGGGAGRIARRLAAARARDHAPPPSRRTRGKPPPRSRRRSRSGSLKAFTRFRGRCVRATTSERVHKNARRRATERVSISARTPRRAVHVRAAAISVSFPVAPAEAGDAAGGDAGNGIGPRGESDARGSSAQTDFEDVVAAVRPSRPTRPSRARTRALGGRVGRRSPLATLGRDVRPKRIRRARGSPRMGSRRSAPRATMSTLSLTTNFR